MAGSWGVRGTCCWRSGWTSSQLPVQLGADEVGAAPIAAPTRSGLSAEDDADVEAELVAPLALVEHATIIDADAEAGVRRDEVVHAGTGLNREVVRGFTVEQALAKQVDARFRTDTTEQHLAEV